MWLNYDLSFKQRPKADRPLLIAKPDFSLRLQSTETRMWVDLAFSILINNFHGILLGNRRKTIRLGPVTTTAVREIHANVQAVNQIEIK